MALGRRYWILLTSSALANLGDGIFVVAVALVAVAEWLGVRAVFLLTGGLVIALIVPLALVVTDDAIADAEAVAEAR